MGRLTITRGKEWFAKLLYFHVFVDNAEIGSVGYNNRANFELPDGLHSMYVKIGEVKSYIVPINISASTETIFKIIVPGLWNPINMLIGLFDIRRQISFKDISPVIKADES